ncbi:MAG: type II secretion system protein GspJ [Thermodesulfobacteriota bacterium]
MGKGGTGFTLLEVLVAMTVMAIVLTAVYGISTSVSTAKERLERDGEGFHQARVVMDRIAREIRSAAFVMGDPESNFRAGIDAGGQSFLDLATSVTSPELEPAAGISRVRYEVRRRPAADGSLGTELLRREQTLLPGGTAGAVEHRLGTAVHRFRLRFSDGQTWVEEWDGAGRGRLPQAVELSLAIEVDGRILPFVTALDVPQVQMP